MTEALKEAKEALERITELVDGTGFAGSIEFMACQDAIDTIDHALSAQQEQKPVACRFVDNTGDYVYSTIVYTDAEPLYLAAPQASQPVALTDEREAFEKWVNDHPVRAEKLPLDRWPTNDGYKDTRTYTAFYGWKARALLAAQPSAEAIRRAALEECAVHADALAKLYETEAGFDTGYRMACSRMSEEFRALAQAPKGETK